MKYIIPTESRFRALCHLYVQFQKDHINKHGGDKLFAASLNKALKPYYAYLVKAVPNDGVRRRLLRGFGEVHYLCKLCGNKMFGTKSICSNSCIRNSAAAIAKTSGWRVLKLYKGGRGSLITKVSAVCTSCEQLSDKHIHHFLAGYSCRCQRNRKISDSHKKSYGHHEYTNALSRSGAAVRLIGTYKGSGVPIKFKCLHCKNFCDALPGNILKNRGCYTCGQEKLKNNCMATYGVEHHIQRPDVQSKIRAAMKTNWGVEHALQNKALFEKMQKSSATRVLYKLGKRIVEIQGYEPAALDWLKTNTSIKARQIFCGGDTKVPTINYSYLGKECSYHPDIFIPHLNMLIEVKSVYTYKAARKRNIIKAKACKAQGYNFRFLVMNKDGTRNHDYKTNNS